MAIGHASLARRRSIHHKSSHALALVGTVQNRVIGAAVTLNNLISKSANAANPSRDRSLNVVLQALAKLRIKVDLKLA